MYRAIIIDDEKWVIRSLQMILTNQHDFEVVGEAYNGIEGLELIQKEKPDLAFVDIRMPGLGGLDLIQEVTRQNLPTLFVVISGHAEFAYAQKAIFFNAIGYCLKPFSSSEIIDILQKSLLLIEPKEKLPSEENTLSPQDSFPFLPPPATHNKSITLMLNYIHRNFQEDIPIQKLADICNINANYASQLFSQEMGKTYSSYLMHLRINCALELLKTSNATISEISEQVGYKDYFYFAKVFKKIVGLTPSAFRSKGGSS